MKCNEPKPGDSWRTCELKLKHAGSHKYLNDRWPRPVLNLPDPEIEELLERTRPANTWGIEERKYPVVVVETVTRVLWVEAETEDDALAYWADDYTDIDLDRGHVLDGDLEFRRLEDYEREEAFRVEMGREFGPQLQCPDCRRLSFERAWFHDPYRKCHGPIVWRKNPGAVRAYREYEKTPVFDATRKQVAA